MIVNPIVVHDNKAWTLTKRAIGERNVEKIYLPVRKKRKHGELEPART